ncbi:hypothetical protein JR316_0000156 [Psilocybe cubensis]|uniref:Uncharacterized protein n=2 Tax=Psilocybe cubensis TaxID=181762 RepID=A0ACB8HEF8_PSICU|nr:hypothetical protein JR316_0000156 [Psilocybe cubensis]KAH9486092.1 hypothetical protein JR316_0000156 [Psilocybe cubensis]
MRRAQSVRNHARPSLALAADDLGVLREGDESNEDVLRRQLLEKDRECDRLQMTITALQTQLAQRPPIEEVQRLEKEFKNLDLILQGTQRENEKCMADIERAKAREKMLERELTRLAGDNWQANLEIPSSSNVPIRSSSGLSGGLSVLHQRSNTISSPISFSMARNHSPTPSLRGEKSTAIPPRSSGSPAPSSSSQHPHDNDQREAQRQAALAQIEQVRMLILGMDQKLDTREEKLNKMLERAEEEGRKFEAKVVEARMAAGSPGH